MSTHAYEFWQRRQAEQRREEREQRRIAKLEREAAEPEEQDFVGYVRELADGTASKREKAQQALKRWNKNRAAPAALDEAKKTRSLHIAADLLSEAL